MKKFYALPIFCFLFFSAFSQNHPFQCISPNDSTIDLPKNFDKYQTGEKSIVQLQTVVHVIYDSDYPNLTDELVEEIIHKVNEKFRRQNADTINTPDAFKPVAADTEIEFVLASVDPSGGPTNGVTYTQTQLDLSGPNLPPIHFDSTGGHDAWDPYKYVNIWLVKRFLPVGLSTTPFSHGQPIDGVVSSYILLNSDELAVFITHFLGHYLGLNHPFKYDDFSPSPTDTCSTAPGGPDGLEDTPNQLLATNSCPEFPLLDICSPDSPGVMFMNYMDFSFFICKNMFTHQQAAVMNWVLDSIRFSLLEPVTSIDENDPDKNMEVHIYPNPVREKLMIEFQNSPFSNNEIQIFDSMGRQVFTGVLEGFLNSKNEINIAHLPHGIYLLKIKSGHVIKTRRIMKL